MLTGRIAIYTEADALNVGMQAGLVHFTRSASGRLAKAGINLYCLCPQFVDTPLVSSVKRLGQSMPEMGVSAADATAGALHVILISMSASLCLLGQNWDLPASTRPAQALCCQHCIPASPAWHASLRGTIMMALYERRELLLNTQSWRRSWEASLLLLEG